MAQTTDIQCSDDVFSGLVALFNAVIFRKFPESIVDPADMDEMADMLQALRPDMAEVGMLRGLVAVIRQDWQEGGAIFCALRERRLCVPSSDAMAALCMNSLGDANWREVADELLASDAANDSHRQLVRALIARADLERAASEASVRGVYNEPDSVRELIERNQRAQEMALIGEAEPVATAHVAVGTYLRV